MILTKLPNEFKKNFLNKVLKFPFKLGHRNLFRAIRERRTTSYRYFEKINRIKLEITRKKEIENFIRC